MAVNHEPATISPLEALLELTRSASEDSLALVLESVADTIHQTAGYATVALNVFRRAWDDYKAVLVIGGPESRGALQGTTTSRAAIEQLSAGQRGRLPGVSSSPRSRRSGPDSRRCGPRSWIDPTIRRPGSQRTGWW